MAKVKSSGSTKANEVPKEKIELVKKITKLLEDNNTIMFASIKSLPSQQFQKIKKSAFCYRLAVRPLEIHQSDMRLHLFFKK